MDKETNTEKDIRILAANTIRCLALDAIQAANSGHPGMPMGCADLALVLWLKFLKHNPDDPFWPERDRFVLSAGHGSMLLYSLLHLSGYDLPMNQIKRFRQWESITPGHPEFGHTPGVEVTTGPLGQGFATGVGIAMAERHLAEVFNQPDLTIVDHYTYGIVSDGDLMEGISSEAGSLAGFLKLGKLIYIYDCNHVTIEGSTSLCFDNEDVIKRFEAYGWHTLEVDGHDMDKVEEALSLARGEKNKPTLILAHTHIAHGSPNMHDEAGSHGAPLGIEEMKLTKRNLGFDEDREFFVPEAVYELFSQRSLELQKKQEEWEKRLKSYQEKYPDKARLWERYHKTPTGEELDRISPASFEGEEIATRAASGKSLQVLARNVPNLIGGSADLAPSTKTSLKDYTNITGDSFTGRNIHFGIREHAMGGVMNGMALHGGIIPYGGTFLVFSDYMRPSIRLAAMMQLKVIYVFTHDSIFLGEDGPTHQPIEQLMGLRLIPGLAVIRPADGAETFEAWKQALARNGPTALVLTRQKLPLLDRGSLAPAGLLSRGAYVLAGADEKADCLLIATGSEVALALEARKLLLQQDIHCRVINFPCWEFFKDQPDAYKDQVIPKDIPVRLVIEAACGVGWEKYIGPHGGLHTINSYGASAPAKVLAEQYGFKPEAVAEHVKELLGRLRE